MDAAGDFVIVYQSYAAVSGDVTTYAQLYNAAGTLQNSSFPFNGSTTPGGHNPNVAMDAAGDFVVTWYGEGSSGGESGIFAEAFNAAGIAAGTDFRVNSGPQAEPAIAMDANGDFTITETSIGTGGFVYAQNFSGNFIASPAGPEFQVNTYTSGSQELPKVATDAAGDYVIVWESYFGTTQAHTTEIDAQRYNAAGVAQGSQFQVNTSTTGDHFAPVVAMDATGDFVIAWIDDAASSSFEYPRSVIVPAARPKGANSRSHRRRCRLLI